MVTIPELLENSTNHRVAVQETEELLKDRVKFREVDRVQPSVSLVEFVAKALKQLRIHGGEHNIGGPRTHIDPFSRFTQISCRPFGPRRFFFCRFLGAPALQPERSRRPSSPIPALTGLGGTATPNASSAPAGSEVSVVLGITCNAIARAAEKAGYDASVERGITWKRVEEELQAGHHVIALLDPDRLYFGLSGMGHIVLIIGLENDDVVFH